LPDEHQLRFNKHKTAQELWAAILKIFGGNEATKKTKKNLLKQQYDNFKADGSETLEQTFNRLQVIVSQLEFMDIEIEQDDLNQNFLTRLASEWLMHTIVWRNRSDLDTMSLDDLYNHLKVYESEVQKKSELNSQNMAFTSSAKNSSGNGEVNTASIPTASTQVSPDGPNVATASISLDTTCAYYQIDEDDIEEMDINGNEATKKTKKNLLKQQYGNFKVEGSETLEQTFNRLQVYESEVQKKSESNPQNMAFISSAKHSRGHEDVNTASVSTASTNVPTASANIGVTSISQDTACAYITSQSSGSQIKFEDINQIDEDDIEEMDIKWNMAFLSMRADKFWKKTRKKISIKGSDVAGFDKSK
nr:hypothetical protein [Tanacetum cinerariifolium]